MLKKLFRIFLFSNLVSFGIVIDESTFPSRQKLILSLSQHLFIKNVILFKPPLLSVDTISFAKLLSESKIYTSCYSMQEVRLIRDGFNSPKMVFSKTLILTFNEEFNSAIYELISEDELTQSRFLWLVWVSNKNRTSAKKGFYYIPYNSQLLIVRNYPGKKNISYISEMYHPAILSRALFKRHFGIWSENEGLEIPEMDLYKRRLDMNGTSLDMYMTEKRPPGIQWIDFVTIIIVAMNFEPTLVNFDDVTLACETRNGDCEIDLRTALYDHYVMDVLGFMTKESVYMYIRYDEIYEDYKIITYMRPFSSGLWGAILIFLLLAGACSLILIYKNPSDFELLSALCHPLEAFMNQGDWTPKSSSMRIAILTTRLAALFIVPSYSAFLLTYILFPNIKFPFEDFKGLVQDGTYKIGFSVQSNLSTWFNDNNDDWVKTAYANYSMGWNEMPKNELEITEKICSYKKASFVTTNVLTSLARCKVIRIPNPVVTGWLCLDLRDKSPYRKIFNRILKSILSSGVSNKYDKYYQEQLWEEKSQNPYHQDENEEVSVEIKNVKSILQLLSLLYATSIILLLLECIYKKLALYIQKLKFFGSIKEVIETNQISRDLNSDTQIRSVPAKCSDF